MADDKANVDRGGEGVNFSLKNAKPEAIMQRLDEQRERFAKQDAQNAKLNATPTKQQLRDKGLALAMKHVARQYPFMARGERRKLAVKMHRDGWKQRDKQAIQKLTGASQTR